MTFYTALRVLPLVLLIACESKQETVAVKQATIPPKVPLAPPQPQPSSPQKATQKFIWHDEACTNIGYYKTGAYTPRQLRNTYQLANGFLLTTTVTPFQLSQYNDAFFLGAARHLTREHDSLATLISGLQTVASPLWRNIKKLRALELAEGYALKRATLEGYFHPSSWLTNPYYAHCADYANALASTDTVAIMKAWRKLVDEQKVNSGIPESLEAAFTAQSASPERMRYAKVELMTFGWGNCANAQLKYNDLSNQYPLQTEFIKLFKHVEQSDCADLD